MNVMEEIFEIRSCIEILANGRFSWHMSSYSWPRYIWDFYRSDDSTNSIKALKKTVKDDRQRFCTFKINSSPSAFCITKPTCLSWLVFKVNKCLKNYRKLQTRRFVYVAEWWRHLSGRIQTSSLFVPRAPLNSIFVTLSA